jgi:predicted flap endonuclease-1-like 5' DNA nuclease
MNLQQLVEALDAQILQGDIAGAFDVFAADNCITFSSPSDVTRTKAQKAEALRWFFNNIASVNRIERIALSVQQDVSNSQFVFDFTNNFGENLVFQEVIRRTWKDGKIVEEQYLMGQTIDQTQPAAGSAPAKKADKPAAKPAAKKTGEQAPAKKAATSAAKTAKPAAAPVQSDDLGLIEGIGPKIAELLNNAGITTFAQLANTKPAAIKTILEAAGKRYQMHDPATWPKQAALARDGKTVELQKLQDQLKGGRK